MNSGLLPIDNEAVVLWYRIYVEGFCEDPHQEFAEFLGISRQGAKLMAYKIAYNVKTSPIMRAYD